MVVGMEVGLSPGDFMLDGDPEPPTHFYCGQTVGCIKVPNGMEVGLIPGDFVRWRPSPPSPKRNGAPNFRPMSIVAKRLHGSRCCVVRK